MKKTSKFKKIDYEMLLCNMHQRVVEGVNNLKKWSESI